MLSICIPVYNYDVRDLCHSLLAQADAGSIFTEIILLDDGSENNFREMNHSLLSERVHYHQLTSNHGRGFARNYLASLARGEFLLFLDCDSKIIRNDFLKKYMENATADIICGGRLYDREKPSKEYLLHWTYGIMVESKDAGERNKNPYVSFMTNNFLAARSVFNKISFTEKLKGYGHEDTMFGYHAKQNKITIRHIDNPVLHLQLEKNQNFISKSEEAVNNLAFLQEVEKGEFENSVKLLRSVRKMKQTGLWKLFLLIAPSVRNITAKLLTNTPNLKMFNLFKLSAFATAKQGRK